MELPAFVRRRRWTVAAVGLLLFVGASYGQSWLRGGVLPTPDPATGHVVWLTLDKGQPKGYTTWAGDLGYSLFSALNLVGVLLVFAAMVAGLQFNKRPRS
ncbi:MAG TPA: hypothetical protein VH722_04195 [Alphaproteobacteria bacterium]|jgi:hypothetical protein|nr:hypothetical protein [Alphaproteobacteria bacterium]